ncbi:orotidine 5''-phosphate decarboxylase, subfamily 2 [Halobacteroides halobius DSM 5150]|uniref:Orotidine 5'-phosphate decarboxylase n=1 Tax=Halobacteroides halobius (strain ATCC 35273 / DSM 5150 / MD-1) TaxID=748449 RepID=L0K798_HALHC|nr:orotidine-5'-phosphate decarboxylase [Halobacteroides halobius]AGB40876.1 orotidine 5''-phosphate decarboxylase, subfamily 2 [Halobacteroides halobius DSM 5150]
MNFTDRLIAKVKEKKSHVCVGLDPRLDRIPDKIREEAIKKYGETKEAVVDAFLTFNQGIIDAVKDDVAIIKPQMAFYEKYGYQGIKAFEKTVAYAKKQGLLVITDAKRNDIGSTAKAYADSYLGSSSKSDSLTVTPYLGSDGIKPFITHCQANDKGVFILVKTSNPSAGELQDLELKDGDRVYEKLARLVEDWGMDSIGDKGYSSVGAVIGATYPQEARKLRKIMKHNYFLVPGYGAQGGGAKDVVPCFNQDGLGAVVNSSRGIIFAYQQEDCSNDYQQAAKKAVLDMKEDINTALQEVNKLTWE